MSFQKNSIFITCGVLLIIGLTMSNVNVSAKNSSVFGQFQYGVSVENEEIPTKANLVSGPWVLSSWQQQNTKFLQKFLSPFNSQKTPYIYMYVSAGKARTDWGLQDCNVGQDPNKTLCRGGANYIRNNANKIHSEYQNIANNIKQIHGSQKEIVLHIEPDFYQYNSDTQIGGGLSVAEAANYMNSWTDTIKSVLPNSTLVLDVSPWNSNLKDWSRGMRNFDYAGMVGKRFSPAGNGSTKDGVDGKTYKKIIEQTAKKLIIDDSHGVGGYWLPFGYEWGDKNLLSERINDGVVAVLTPPNDIGFLNSLLQRTATNTTQNNSLDKFSNQNTLSSSCESNSIKWNLSKTDEWKEGFVVKLIANNTSNSTKANWKIKVIPSKNQSITNVWNMNNNDGTMIPKYDWNTSINPHQTSEMGGFVIQKNGTNELPNIDCD